MFVMMSGTGYGPTPARALEDAKIDLAKQIARALSPIPAQHNVAMTVTPFAQPDTFGNLWVTVLFLSFLSSN